jgi:alanyl-tRNA synthetase
MKLLNIFRLKVSVPAALLIAAAVAAIAVLVIFQIRINQFNNEVSELYRLAAEDQTAGSQAMAEIDAIQAENEALRAENNTLKADNSVTLAEYDALHTENETLAKELEALRQYQLTFYVPREYDLVVDQRLETELVNLIKKHFNATAAGNLDVYRSTLIQKDSDYLLSFFESRKNSDMAVTAISAPDILGDRPLEGGPIFLEVTYKKEGALNVDRIGVTKINKKWVIYDYD